MPTPAPIIGSKPGPRSVDRSLVLGLVLIGLFVVVFGAWRYFDPDATFVADLSASGPVMGTWRLAEDDHDFAARGLAVPDVWTIEPFVPGAGEELPAGFEPDRVARLRGGGRSVLFTTQSIVHPFVPGSGDSPFAELGVPGDVGMMLSLRGWPGWLDTLSIDLGGVGDGVNILGRGSPRLSYQREGMRR